MTIPPMHPRAAFRISLAAGLLVLAVTLFSATQEPVRPCGNLPQNYAPIIAFELARNAADLEAIFGTQEPCRAEVIERMDAINVVDVLVYIPATACSWRSSFSACARAMRRSPRSGFE